MDDTIDEDTGTKPSNISEVDIKINSNTRKVHIISDLEISGISSLLNVGDISNNELISMSDLDLIDPMQFEQVTENSPKLSYSENPRRNRKRACRKFTTPGHENQKVDSETENEDFSPSDGSVFDPDLYNDSDDGTFSVIPLSDIQNDPHNKRFWKKSLLEKHGSSPDIFSVPKLCENNNQTSEFSFLNSTLKEGRKFKENNKRIEQEALTHDDTPSSMIMIEDPYDAEADLEESSSDSESKQEELEEPAAKNLKKKRKWVRKNACIFCEQLVTNFSRHLLKNHKNESEVLKYMSINDPDLKVRKQRRREITDELRNRGNFIHNSTAIFEKEGNIIPKKGKCPISSPSTFTTCKKCLGTFKRKYFYKHFKNCGSDLLNIEKLPNSYKRRVLANHSISIIPHLSAASQEVKDHILPRLRSDEISSLVKSDPLILAFGSRLMKKKKEARSRKAICSKLRDLGNLLLHLKAEDPSIKKLSDLFKPQHYPTFMKCVKKMCGFNEDTGFLQTISIPSRLRPSVLGCIEVLYTEMIMGHESQAYKEALKKQLDEFKLLIEINWEWEISSNAEKTRKRNLMTKETVMPLDEDIKTITEKIHELEKIYSKQLKKEVTVLNYENLCEVTIAHIIVMDKKRAGDVAEAELCFYLNRKDEVTPDKVLELLSQQQKEAVNQLDVFMIPGKRTRSVPVLLTKQMRRNIDRIVANRKVVGVADNNPLLFARPLTSRPFDGGKCLNKIKSMCKLKNPKMLTSTGVRHHIATMSQLHAKKNDQYTEHLAGFLGHDLGVHSSNYRLPLQVIQKAIIGSSLMEFEKKETAQTTTLELGMGSPKSTTKKPETVTSKTIELEQISYESHKDQQESIDVTNINQNEEPEKEKDKKKLDDHDEENLQEEDNLQDTDNTVEIEKSCNEEQNPLDIDDLDKIYKLSEEINLKRAQDCIVFDNRNENSQESGTVRNVKGQFQGNPQKNKINESNSESNDFEENQIIPIENLNSKSFDSSSDSSSEKDLTRKRKALDHSEEPHSSSDELLSVLRTKKQKTTRARWTDAELKAVRTYFKDNIKNKTNPGKAKCLEVLKKVPVLSKRTWMQINTQVNNIYKKKI